MEEKLTELEKSVLLAFLVLSKGKKEKYIKSDLVVFKFPRQQRKAVRKSLERLVTDKLLVKNPKELSYKLTEDGVKRSMKILAEGAILWKL